MAMRVAVAFATGVFVLGGTALVHAQDPVEPGSAKSRKPVDSASAPSSTALEGGSKETQETAESGQDGLRQEPTETKAEGPEGESDERVERVRGRETAGWPEERTPPGVPLQGIGPREDAFTAKDSLQFALHGYFRAPLRMSWAKRSGALKAGEGEYDYRTPWLVDDDYFRSGFQYTHIQESDWAELYLMAGNRQVTANVTLLGSLFSDSARPLIDRQLGIAQAWLTMRWEGEVAKQRWGVRLKGGSFWDRFGWLPKYDTYMFGRTHQAGEQVKAVLEGDHYRITALHGIGAHLEAIDANQGYTLLHYAHVGAELYDRVSVGLYHLDSWTKDKRKLKELEDAEMVVTGADVRLRGGFLGQGYLAYSWVDAEKATYLGPAIEVMHSYGGRGLAENYLGTEKSENGTGGLKNFAFQYDVSLASILKTFARDALPALRGGDATASLFGLYAITRSPQASPDPAVNRDGRHSFKWGAEVAYFPVASAGLSVRYDRVVQDVDDNASAFRILSPRISVRRRFDFGEGQLYLQWSRYVYGDRVRLRPGQVALESMPDDNVVKLQGQVAF